jgi:DNA invertase Pin-like site-specific DNA recombinase
VRQRPFGFVALKRSWRRSLCRPSVDGCRSEAATLGISFISLHEGVDTSTPNGKLIFGIFASIAEFERELIRDRICSAVGSCKGEGSAHRTS